MRVRHIDALRPSRSGSPGRRGATRPTWTPRARRPHARPSTPQSACSAGVMCRRRSRDQKEDERGKRQDQKRDGRREVELSRKSTRFDARSRPVRPSGVGANIRTGSSLSGRRRRRVVCDAERPRRRRARHEQRSNRSRKRDALGVFWIAPSAWHCSARRWSSSSSRAEWKMTATRRRLGSLARSLARASPETPGIATSSNTTSGSSRATAAVVPTASSRVTTSYPRATSLVRVTSRTRASSSTTSTFVDAHRVLPPAERQPESGIAIERGSTRPAARVRAPAATPWTPSKRNAPIQRHSPRVLSPGRIGPGERGECAACTGLEARPRHRCARSGCDRQLVVARRRSDAGGCRSESRESRVVCHGARGGMAQTSGSPGKRSGSRIDHEFSRHTLQRDGSRVVTCARARMSLVQFGIVYSR